MQDECTECRGILLRVYRELREAGYSDSKAFQSAVRVMELRHPGRERGYTLYVVATWIAAESDL